jgi:predicted component of type VI protein secretion system
MGMMKTVMLSLGAVALVISQSAVAGDEERNQAKRIHDRLTGVNATNAVLDDMESLLNDDASGKSAARYAIDRANNPNAR